MTKKEAMRLKAGQWVRVMFVDVGARDGILLQKWTKEDSWVRVFFPFDDCISSVDGPAQIVSKGNRLTAENSGL
jgi:hypothetical protein